MKYHDFLSLREFHIEITNRCNASCPMCARNHFGGPEKKDFPLDEWSVVEAEKVFSSQFENLRNILFCGTHGDPAVARDGLGIVAMARANTQATIEFYSNGSVRSPSWWQELGQIMRFKRDDDYYRRSDLGIFSIDGLADTNHLYRRNTQFEKIMANAEAFIKAGGRARWDYIVFKHNEHQVEEAEKLAKKMGFFQFRIRKTSRFAYSPDGPTRHRVLNKNGEIEYYLEPAQQEKYLNEQKKNFEEVVRKTEQRDQGLSQKEIRCLNKNQFQRMYINAHLKVFPCCFVSNDTYPGKGVTFVDTKEKVVKRYGEEFNDLRVSSWEDILSHSWFRQDLVESWKNPDERLLRCQRTCSVECNPITSQSEDRKV